MPYEFRELEVMYDPSGTTADPFSVVQSFILCTAGAILTVLEVYTFSRDSLGEWDLARLMNLGFSQFGESGA